MRTQLNGWRKCFAEERSKLERDWDRGDNVSTEDLRVALQRYNGPSSAVCFQCKSSQAGSPRQRPRAVKGDVYSIASRSAPPCGAVRDSSRETDRCNESRGESATARGIRQGAPEAERPRRGDTLGTIESITDLGLKRSLPTDWWEKQATTKSEVSIASSIARGQFCPGSSFRRSSQGSKFRFSKSSKSRSARACPPRHMPGRQWDGTARRTDTRPRYLA